MSHVPIECNFTKILQLQTQYFFFYFYSLFHGLKKQPVPCAKICPGSSYFYLVRVSRVKINDQRKRFSETKNQSKQQRLPCIHAECITTVSMYENFSRNVYDFANIFVERLNPRFRPVDVVVNAARETGIFSCSISFDYRALSDKYSRNKTR